MSFSTVDCLEKGSLVNEHRGILGKIKYDLKNKHLKAKVQKGWLKLKYFFPT